MDGIKLWDHLGGLFRILKLGVNLKLTLKKFERRKESFKVILKRMYEDMILGKVSEIMYNEISKEYEIKLTKISDIIEQSGNLINSFKNGIVLSTVIENF